jgi:protein-L-isoaspartate(D-aspartate) O-methyltransferase
MPWDPPEAQTYRDELVSRLELDVPDPKVRDVMRRVPRHLFVPDASLWGAYRDYPLPIGHAQTISQPTIVGIMTAALELTGTERVLEIGTGSGYQAAILSLLAAEVFTVEVVPELAVEARARLETLGYTNVNVRTGDGYVGWPELAPFDRILVTAAPPVLPASLLRQLKDPGILIAPIGDDSWDQRLVRIRLRDGRTTEEDLGGVRFVPMVEGALGQ